MNVIRMCVSAGLICLLCGAFLSLTPGVGIAGQSERAKILKEFEAADTNKDGYVDENEYRRFVGKEFKSIDKNKDHRIEGSELATQEGPEFKLTEKERKGKILFKTFLNGRLRFFNEADANKDRLLSLQEYTEMKFMDPVK